MKAANKIFSIPPVLCAFLLFAISCTNQAAMNEQELSGPDNIILLIGDGMGVAQVTAARNVNNHSLRMTDAPYVGLITTHSTPTGEGSGITDSAAGATALAAGVETYNGAIGVDPEGNPVRSILQIAHDRGLATGLVASSSITHATPASFIAHQPSRSMNEEIAADFLNTDIDLFIGGGLRYFTQREDGRDLVAELTDKEYRVSYDLAEMRSITGGKLAGFIAEGEPARYSEGRGDMLPEATKIALDILSRNENGFFLMVEGSQIDWGGHDNNTEYIVEEMLDFDNVVKAALDFAERDGNTLVVITADHETGGTTINRFNHETGETTAEFTTGSHTGSMVPVFAFGPGAHLFSGVYHNTEIFHKSMTAFGFDNSQ